MWRRLYRKCEVDLLAFRWLYNLDDASDSDVRDDESSVILFRAADPDKGVRYGQRSYVHHLVHHMDRGTQLPGVAVWLSCWPRRDLPPNRIGRVEHYLDAEGRSCCVVRVVRMEFCSECGSSMFSDDRILEAGVGSRPVREVHNEPYLHKCSQCVAAGVQPPARYCDTGCQRRHWRAGHGLWHTSQMRAGKPPTRPTLAQEDLKPLCLATCVRCSACLLECRCRKPLGRRRECEAVD